ncbi:hypothetical protein K438DRAFT_282165 [Mycena galopus ATCC 62051]|nr:hypothetical protein K438DRAFT_282165 [Mycena galopus ATCC 62051]
MAFQLPAPHVLSPSFVSVPPILSVPQDVIHNILAWVSPPELQTLRSTAKIFQQTIDGAQGTNVWRHAFRNVCLPPAVNTPFPPSQIAALTFGGGPCYKCGEHARVLPYSFTLQIWFCSLACQYMKCLRSDLQHHTTLPAHLPYLEGTAERPLYKPQHVNDAWEKFFIKCRESSSGPSSKRLLPLITPCTPVSNPVMDAWVSTGEELCAGATQYSLIKQQVESDNYAALQAIAQALGVTFLQLTRSPTLARKINVLMRDLKVLDVHAWNQMRPVVEAELVLHIPQSDATLPCPHCSATSSRTRLFKEDALHAHIVRSHPEYIAEHVAIPGIHRCTLCPPSKTVVWYNRAILFHHIDNVHC